MIYGTKIDFFIPPLGACRGRGLIFMTYNPNLIRERVLAMLAKKEWSRYRLVQELAGEIPASTIYGWLAGKCRINDDKASIIFSRLEL